MIRMIVEGSQGGGKTRVVAIAMDALSNAGYKVLVDDGDTDRQAVRALSLPPKSVVIEVRQVQQ